MGAALQQATGWGDTTMPQNKRKEQEDDGFSREAGGSVSDRMAALKQNMDRASTSHESGADALRAQRQAEIQAATGNVGKDRASIAGMMEKQLASQKKAEGDKNLVAKIAKGNASEAEIEAFFEPYVSDDGSELNMNNTHLLGKVNRKQKKKLMVQICKFIKTSGVAILQFNNSQVDDGFCQEIASAAGKSGTVTHLHLDSNPIGKKGINALAKMVKGNTVLRELTLNNLGKAPPNGAVKSLVSALEKCPTLLKLSIEIRATKQSDLREKYLKRNWDAVRSERRAAKAEAMGHTDAPRESERELPPEEFPGGVDGISPDDFREPSWGDGEGAGGNASGQDEDWEGGDGGGDWN